MLHTTHPPPWKNTITGPSVAEPAHHAHCASTPPASTSSNRKPSGNGSRSPTPAAWRHSSSVMPSVDGRAQRSATTRSRSSLAISPDRSLGSSWPQSWRTRMTPGFPARDIAGPGHAAVGLRDHRPQAPGPFGRSWCVPDPRSATPHAVRFRSMSRHHRSDAIDPTRSRPTPPTSAQLGALGSPRPLGVAPPPLGGPGVARDRGLRRLPRPGRQEGGLGQLPHPRHGLAVGLRPAPGAVLQPERRHRHRRVLGARGPEAHRPRQRRGRGRRHRRPGQGRRRDVGARPAHPEPPDPARPVRRRARSRRGPGGRGPRPEPAALGVVRRPVRLRQRHLRQEPPRPARAVPAQARRRPARSTRTPTRRCSRPCPTCPRATSPSPSAAPSPTPTTARSRGGRATPTRSASASAPSCCSSPSARCSAWPSRSPPPCSAPSPPAASSTCWPPSPPCRRPPRR